MAFNLFKRIKKSEDVKSSEQPSELTSESSETASSPEDSKLLESQLEALENVNEEMKDEEKEEKKLSREHEESEVATEAPVSDTPFSGPHNMEEGARKEEAALEDPKEMIKEAKPKMLEEKTGETAASTEVEASPAPSGREEEREAKESVESTDIPARQASPGEAGGEPAPAVEEGVPEEPKAASPFDEGQIEISQKEAPSDIPVVPEKESVEGGKQAEEETPVFPSAEEVSHEEVTSPEPQKEEKEPEASQVSTPLTSEDVQKGADEVSSSFEGGEGGGKSSFVRFGVIVVLIVLIVGGGAFAYLQFFGSSSQPLSLKNIPYLGTYLGGSQSEPSVPSPTTPTTPELTPSPVPAPTPEPEPVSEPVPVPQGVGDSERIADLDNLSTQLLAYYAENASYPSTNGEIEKILSGTDQDLVLYTALVPAYFFVLPVDPNSNFYYGYSSDGTSYELTSVLEDRDNPECVLAGDFCVRRIVDGEVVSLK